MDFKDTLLVSLNILSFNRKDELRITLTKVFEQDYQNIEVIVVDNASSDGSPEMVKEVFPMVILIQLEENIGIAGWDEGLKISNGEYILLLDDDAYPNKNSIFLSVQKLNSNKKIGCIAFNVINNNSLLPNFRSSWLPGINIVECEWPIFIGCASMFRKSLNLGMPKDYFIYQHELPIAADIYNKGYQIYYDSQIIAYHNFKYETEYFYKNDYYFLRNNLKFIFKYLPFFIAPYYFLKLSSFFFAKAIIKKWVRHYLTIISEVIFIYSGNSKISFKYFLKLRKLELFHIRVIHRILG